MASPAPPPEYRLGPPEIIPAENGFVLRSYDVQIDAYKYEVAVDITELRERLNVWADRACESIRRLAEKQIKAAVTPKEAPNA